MLGVIAMGAGRPGDAVVCFGKAVAEAPADAQYANNHGVALRALGRAVEASDAFRRAIVLDPSSIDGHCNLGNALCEVGDALGAEAAYSAALALDPLNVSARKGLAAAARLAGALDRAAGLYRELLADDPSDSETHNNLGVVAMEQGDVNTAIGCYKIALEHDSNNLECLNNISVAMMAKGDGSGAETTLRRVLAVRPDWCVALANLGNALRRQGKYLEASEAYRRALAIKPDNGLKFRLATLLPVIADSAATLKAARRQMEAAVDALEAEEIAIADPVGEVGITHFHLSYHDAPNRSLNAKVARLYARACPSLSYVAPHCEAPRKPAGRLRVGFVSRHFRDHAVGWCYHRLIRNLPRDRIETVAITFREDNDPLWRAIASDVDRAVVAPLDLQAARERIARERLDVLVYTDIGMEPVTYFLAFARLAPVQCVTNGHPDTTGIPTLDFFVSSGPLETPDAPAHYSETLVALEDVLVDYERPETPAPLRERAAFGLPETATLYVCPQSLFKLHPDMDGPLGCILAGDPNARLIVFHGPEPHWWDLLERRWRKTFADKMQQVQVLPRQSYSDFLNILRLADVVLDTWPFCGGNTAYQALAMGVPIVTHPGRFARGRSTMALYRKLGIGELIAGTPDEYVARALRLGTQPEWRAEVAARIDAVADRLFGDTGAAAAFGRFLLDAGASSRGEA